MKDKHQLMSPRCEKVYDELQCAQYGCHATCRIENYEFHDEKLYEVLRWYTAVSEEKTNEIMELRQVGERM